MSIICHNSPVATQHLCVLNAYELAELIGRVTAETGRFIYSTCVNFDGSLDPDRDEICAPPCACNAKSLWGLLRAKKRS